jgi:hypothetical protein
MSQCSSAAASAPSVRWETLAAELVRALRGRRSCAEFSRRIGYRSNIVHRWEREECWPTTARFIAIQQRVRPAKRTWLQAFFGDSALPDWARDCDPASPATVAAFLRHLKGKTTVVRIAELANVSRFSVARWLDGRAQPKLPEFLRMVEACSRRLLDLIAAFADPAQLRSVSEHWSQLQTAREAAYAHPWSHAVLRALELTSSPSRKSHQIPWLAGRLGISTKEVVTALEVLQKTGQIDARRSYRPRRVMTVDTSRDPVRARKLKELWITTALDRLRTGAPGTYGYSLFAVSRADLTRLQTLHSQYVRAMQDVIASSAPSECVGLYCAQLLNLERQ